MTYPAVWKLIRKPPSYFRLTRLEKMRLMVDERITECLTEEECGNMGDIWQTKVSSLGHPKQREGRWLGITSETKEIV